MWSLPENVSDQFIVNKAPLQACYSCECNDPGLRQVDFDHRYVGSSLGDGRKKKKILSLSSAASVPLSG